MSNDSDSRAASYPEPEKALERFVEFLREQGWPTQIWWLSDKGTIALRGRWLVVHRRRRLSWKQVASDYQAAAGRSLGVVIDGIAYDRHHSYCCLWAPCNEDHAHRTLTPDGLKLSVALTRWQPIVVGSLLFRLTRLRQKSVVELPWHDA